MAASSLAIRRISASDESPDICWQGFACVATLLMANDTDSSRLRHDFAPLGFQGFSNYEADRRIRALYELWHAEMLRRRSVVQTFLNPSARLPNMRPIQPPAKWLDLAMLRTATEPEARYWQSRVPDEGLFGQPPN